MNNYIQVQNQKHFYEKQVYEEKIRLLKTQLDSKTANKASGTLGHIYYYKEHDEKNFIPSSLIIEQPEENIESVIQMPQIQ